VKQLTRLDSAPQQQESARGESHKVDHHNNHERAVLNVVTDTPDAPQKNTVPTVTINNVGPSQPSTRNSGVGQGDQREREYLRGRLHKHN